MQMSVPDLIDVKSEPQHIREMYGPDVATPGRYGYNCLLARRLAERGVRFIQLYHRADAHGNTPKQVGAMATPINPPPPPARFKQRSTILSLSGAGNLAAPFTAKESSPRLPMAATIIPTASPTGLPVAERGGIT